MSELLFRTIKKEDCAEVGEILNKAFFLHTYVSDSKTLEAFKLQYVYGCLCEATYASVCELDGKVVGVIMAKANADYKIGKHLKFMLPTVWQGVKMAYHGRRDKTGIRGFNNLHKIYHEFSAKHKGEFDGSLTLFALNEECRGHGVGKTLLNGALSYLKMYNVSNIYLYTDTTCNYGFYEHMGFERLEEKPLKLTKNGKPFTMDVFLYGYEL